MTAATYTEIVAQAETHYLRAVDAFDVAVTYTDNSANEYHGDPQAFDQWLRIATFHIQATGATTALARAVSDRASR
jgi:hypothetical protein